MFQEILGQQLQRDAGELLERLQGEAAWHALGTLAQGESKVPICAWLGCGCPPGAESRVVGQAKTKVEESKHEYDNYEDVKKAITIEGAQRLVFSFDPRCRTESGLTPHASPALVGRDAMTHVNLKIATW